MVWSSFLGTGVTDWNKKSTVAKVSRLLLALRFSWNFPSSRCPEKLLKSFEVNCRYWPLRGQTTVRGRKVIVFLRIFFNKLCIGSSWNSYNVLLTQIRNIKTISKNFLNPSPSFPVSRSWLGWKYLFRCSTALGPNGCDIKERGGFLITETIYIFTRGTTCIAFYTCPPPFFSFLPFFPFLHFLPARSSNKRNYFCMAFFWE